jgi:hypothetical protein
MRKKSRSSMTATHRAALPGAIITLLLGAGSANAADCVLGQQTDASCTIPLGTVSVTVAAIGGGGGGGAEPGAGGGGGGGICFGTFDVVPGEELQFTVGTGGPGAVPPNGVGGAGTRSTVTSPSITGLNAGGGNGGTQDNGGAGAFNGGNECNENDARITWFNGGNGGNSVVLAGAGGGGSAGTNGAGGPGSNAPAGAVPGGAGGTAGGGNPSGAAGGAGGPCPQRGRESSGS